MKESQEARGGCITHRVCHGHPRTEFLMIFDWLVVWKKNFIFHNIWDVILSIDFHIFQDG